MFIEERTRVERGACSLHPPHSRRTLARSSAGIFHRAVATPQRGLPPDYVTPARLRKVLAARVGQQTGSSVSHARVSRQP